MTLPINQTEESTRPSVRLTNSDIQFAGRGPATKRRFEHTFCGVLVALIFAIIGILLAVALLTISGPDNSRIHLPTKLFTVSYDRSIAW